MHSRSLLYDGVGSYFVSIPAGLPSMALIMTAITFGCRTPWLTSGATWWNLRSSPVLATTPEYNIHWLWWRSYSRLSLIFLNASPWFGFGRCCSFCFCPPFPRSMSSLSPELFIIARVEYMRLVSVIVTLSIYDWAFSFTHWTSWWACGHSLCPRCRLLRL